MNRPRSLGVPENAPGSCQAHRILKRAQASLLAELEKETFADMVEMEREILLKRG